MSLSQQGHVAHQRVRLNRRVGGQSEDVQFEERPTPRGQNTYMHELIPEDGHISPGRRTHGLCGGELERQRAHVKLEKATTHDLRRVRLSILQWRPSLPTV